MQRRTKGQKRQMPDKTKDESKELAAFSKIAENADIEPEVTDFASVDETIPEIETSVSSSVKQEKEEPLFDGLLEIEELIEKREKELFQTDMPDKDAKNNPVENPKAAVAESKTLEVSSAEGQLYEDVLYKGREGDAPARIIKKDEKGVTIEISVKDKKGIEHKETITVRPDYIKSKASVPEKVEKLQEFNGFKVGEEVMYNKEKAVIREIGKKADWKEPVFYVYFEKGRFKTVSVSELSKVTDNKAAESAVETPENEISKEDEFFLKNLQRLINQAKKAEKKDAERLNNALTKILETRTKKASEETDQIYAKIREAGEAVWNVGHPEQTPSESSSAEKGSSSSVEKTDIKAVSEEAQDTAEDDSETEEDLFQSTPVIKFFDESSEESDSSDETETPDGEQSEAVVSEEESTPFPSLESLEALSEDELAALEVDLDEARHKYYQLRQKRMKLAGRGEAKGKKGEEKLEESRLAYEEKYNKWLKIKIGEGLKDFNGGPEEKISLLAGKYLDVRKEENDRIFEEFSRAEKSFGEKFKQEWKSRPKARLAVSAALVGGSFLVPWAYIPFLAVRQAISGFGTAMGIEAILEKYGEKGLTQEIYKEYSKKAKKSQEEADRFLQSKLTNKSFSSNVEDEIKRLTVLAERKHKNLGDVFGDKMKPIVEQIYAASMDKMVEQAKLEPTGEKSTEDLGDMLLRSLEEQASNIRLSEQSIGLQERKKEINRWIISAAAGVATGTILRGALKHVFADEIAGSAPIAEVAHLGTAEAGSVPEIAGATVAESAPVEAASEAIAELPPLSHEVAKAVKQAGGDKTHSVWELVEKKCEAGLKAMDPIIDNKEPYREGQLTYIYDAVKDKIAENPVEFGLENIDKVTVEDLARLAADDHFNQLVTDSLSTPDDNFGPVFEKAINLSEKALNNIETNNAFFQNVAGAVQEAGIPLDQHTFDLMSQARGAGFSAEKTADIISSGIKGQGSEVLDFYAQQDIKPSSEWTAFVEAHDAKTVGKIMDLAGRDLVPGSAVERLVTQTDLSSLENAQARNWINLTGNVEKGRVPKNIIARILKKAGIYSELKGKFFGIGDAGKIMNETVSNGVLKFDLNVSGLDNVGVEINTKDLAMKATKKGVAFSSPYLGKNPTEVLKQVIKAISR